MKNTLAKIETHPDYKSKLLSGLHEHYVDLDHINYIMLHLNKDMTATFFMTDSSILDHIINFKEIIHTDWFVPVNLRFHEENDPDIAYLAPRRISQIDHNETLCIIKFIGSEDLWINETPDHLQQLIDVLKPTCLNYKTL